LGLPPSQGPVIENQKHLVGKGQLGKRGLYLAPERARRLTREDSSVCAGGGIKRHASLGGNSKKGKKDRFRRQGSVICRERALQDPKGRVTWETIDKRGDFRTQEGGNRKEGRGLFQKREASARESPGNPLECRTSKEPGPGGKSEQNESAVKREKTPYCWGKETIIPGRLSMPNESKGNSLLGKNLLVTQ